MSKLVIVEVDEKDSEEAILLLSTIGKELNGINESLNQLVTMIKEKRS